MTSPLPPYYCNNDPHSFGFTTARARWPSILKGVSDDTRKTMVGSSELKIAQGKEIVAEIETLTSEILDNAALKPFKSKIPGLGSYNESLVRLGETTWLTGPWLFCECYLYRRLDSFFKAKSEWIEFDPFEDKKRGAFNTSASSIAELCKKYEQIHKGIEKKKPSQTELHTMYDELCEVSLWGNAIDLSLLANASMEELQSRQGSAAIAEASKNVLCNDLDKAWERLVSVPEKERRVDFVLDNAGFEFFTDLVLALFFLDTGLASKVVFHCKTRPWMVSDTMIKDYDWFLDDLLTMAKKYPEVGYFAEHLQAYKKSGEFSLAESEFWTVDLDYWNLSPKETKYGGADLWKYFQDSALVIIKGDLNYRKLTGDRQWPRDIAFTTAIGTLADSGIHLVAFRTCKADVCAGLAPGKNEELSEYWKSLGNEYGELWASSGKWAVISYSGN